jgi:hypothetical protein
MNFDWHGAVLTRETAIDASYKNTQNVRRFLLSECGPQFKFDRDLMAWISDGIPKNLGHIADEWKRRSGACHED